MEDTARWRSGKKLFEDAVIVSRMAHEIQCLIFEYTTNADNYAAELTKSAFGLVLEMATYGKHYKDIGIDLNISESDGTIKGFLNELDSGLSDIKNKKQKQILSRHVGSPRIDKAYGNLDTWVNQLKHDLKTWQELVKQECLEDK